MSIHHELFDKFIGYAMKDQRIRVVEMNGSRANKQIEPDDFQDFDIVFYVNNYDQYIKNLSFIKGFGEILVKQTKNDQYLFFEEDLSSWYIYMAQYVNGTRLDLSIRDIKDIDQRNDSLSQIIINKDELPIKSSSNESSYYVKSPTLRAFQCAVNEFFWLCPYVGKGIARKQEFYAFQHLNKIRIELEKVLDWSIGIKFQFKVSVGKGKNRYFQLLDARWFDMYRMTYSGIGFNEMTNALLTMIDLFDEVCVSLANNYDFEYDEGLINRMKAFLVKRYIKTKAD